MLRKLGVIAGILAVATLMMVGCSGERGVKGDSGTAECVQCHSDNTTIVAIDGQWHNSVHFTGGNFERNTDPCAGCHTSEGFVSKVNTGVSGVPENPSPVGCFACHEPHTNHNFNLRTTAPVTMEVGSNATYDRGLSNLCASCHHARALSPALSGSVTLTSNRWGPHHGPQADVLNGTGAYVFAGEAYRNSAHTSVATEGCPTCHMATAYGTQAGGHTMKLTYDYHGSERELVAGCNNTGCHTGLTDFNYENLQDSVATYLNDLREALVSAAILDSTTDLVNASSSHPLTLTETEAGALYNYLLLEADRSGGVHNSKYVIDALKASVGALSGK